MKYKFTDLVDIAELQELTDELFKASAIPSAIIDIDGKVLTSSGCQRICRDFHRKNPETLKDCIKSDTKIREGLNKGDTFVMYKCPRGLTDASSPIIIKGKHVANVFSGQIFVDTPNKACELQFREQAKQFGFDEDEYMKAFREVPVIPEKEFKSGLLFLSKLAKMIASMGLQKLEELEQSEKRLAEQKKAEEAIRHSKNYYRSIISSLHENVMVIEKDYRISDVNETFLSSTVYRQEEILLYHCYEISHGYNKPCGECGKECKLLEVFETGLPANSLHEHINKDGSKTLFDILYSPVKDESGKVVRVVETARDISDIVRQKEKLEKSELQYKQLAENTETILWEYDVVSDRWLYVAPQVERILGYKPEEWTNLEFWGNCLHDDDRQWATEYCAECVKRGEAHEFEYRFIKKDGETVWLRDVVNVEIKDGMTIKLRGFLLDITKRKLADEKTRINNKRWKEAQKVAKIGNWEFDVASGQIWGSEESFNIYGIPFDIDKNPDQITPLETIESCIPDRKRIHQALMDLITENKPYDLQYEVVRTDNSKLQVIHSKAIREVDKKGNPVKVTGTIQDITQRILADQSLKESEEKFSAISRSALDAVIMIDNKGNAAYWNPAAERMFGYMSEEILGKNVHDMIMPEQYRSRFESGFKKFAETGHGDSLGNIVELIAHRKNSVEFPVEMVVSPIRIKGNFWATAIIRDITKRKQAEEQLHLKSLTLNQIDDRVIMTDLEGSITYVNEANCQMLGMTREELIGQNISILGEDPSTGVTQEEILEDTFKNGMWRGESINFDKDGGKLVLDCRTQVVKDNTGKVISLCGISTDITERKQAADKLIEREKHFRALIENISDVIAILDENGNLLYESPSCVDVLGYQTGELFGKNIFSFVHPDDQERIMQQFAELLKKTDTSEQVYFRFLHQDGSWRDIEGTGKNSLNKPEVKGIVINYRDVTKRKLADAQFVGLFETMPSGVAIYEAVDDGSDFVFKQFNSSGEKLDSIKREDIIGKKVTEVFPSVQEFGLLDVFKRVWETGQAENHPVSLYDDNRIVAWRENHVFKLPSDEIVAIYKDVTAEKLAEDEVKKFRTISNKAVHGSAITDPAGTLIYVNDYFAEVHGYKADELLGQNLSVFHTQNQMEVANKCNETLLSKGSKQPKEVWHVHKDGTEFPMLMSGIVIKDDDSLPQYIAVTAIDITDQKQVELALRQERDNFNNIFEAMEDGIYIVNQKHDIYYVNPVIIKEFGSIDNKKCFEYFHERNTVCPWCKNAEVWEGNSVQWEWYSPKNGKTYDLFDTPITLPDGSLGKLEMFRDISDRKLAESERTKLEAQLQQAQKMESIGRLAGGVAHDFNNLLTGITGNIQLAQMDIATNDPLYETLDEVNAAAKRAADLTRQLLAFSRKQIIKPKIINLNNLINNMHRMLIRIIGEDVDLQTIPMKLLGQIKADPGQVEQIIVNLSVNARDAMLDGGKLTIETGNVTLDEEYCKEHAHAKQGDYIMLAISDDGEGMDQDTRKNIFEPFFTTKEQGKGTGLGLSTVYGIVKQHNGYVEVYSEAGEGTTFKVYFPRVTDKADKITKTSVADDLPTGTETVFVVEDEAVVRNIAVRILKRQGYKVFEAEDGSNALTIIKGQKLSIDLLLTDVVMPKMNGRQLAEKLQETYPKLKVLYTSGYTENVIAHHGMIDEGLEFIGKPYTPQALAIRVRKLLDEK